MGSGEVKRREIYKYIIISYLYTAFQFPNASPQHPYFPFFVRQLTLGSDPTFRELFPASFERVDLGRFCAFANEVERDRSVLDEGVDDLLERLRRFMRPFQQSGMGDGFFGFGDVPEDFAAFLVERVF